MSSFSRYLRKILLTKLDRPSRHYQQRAYNNVEKLYKVVKPGDVVLVEGRSEMSRIIKLFSSSHWSHAALYVGDYLKNKLALDGKPYKFSYGENSNHLVVEAYSGKGVVAEPLEKYKDHNIRLCRPFGIRPEDLKQVIQTVINRLGMHYDDQNILDIAMMALQTIWRRESTYTTKACLGNCNDFEVICSGMIAQAFQSVGYPIVPELLPPTDGDAYDVNNPYGGGLIMRHYSQITPKDFDLSPNFEIIKYNLDGSVPFDYKSLWSSASDSLQQ